MFDTSTPALKTMLPATNPLRAAWKETLAIREGEARKVQGLERSHPWGMASGSMGKIHGKSMGEIITIGEMVTLWSMYINVYNRLQQFSK